MKWEYYISAMEREEALEIMEFVEEYPKTERWAKGMIEFELISKPDDPDAWIEARFTKVPGYIFNIADIDMAKFAFSFAAMVIPESERFDK